MHVIGFVHIDGFYLRSLTEVPPIALLHKDKSVLDVTAGAAARGVRVNMPLAEAKAILARDGHFIAWEEDQFRAAQRAWIDLATEVSDAVQPDGQHAAYLDLSGHPRPAEVVSQLSATLRHRLGLEARIGLARCCWVARAAALRGDTTGSAMLTPKRFVAPLPTRSLPLAEDVLQRLSLLGYPTIGDVARLPLDALREQFGELAFDLKRMTLGGGSAFVEAVFPANCLAERFYFEVPAETVETLEYGAQQVAAKLGSTLRADDASGRQVELFLEREDGPPEIRRRTFAKPIAGAALLMSALRLMLNEVPAQPVTAIRVRLPDIERSKRVQFGLDGERSRRDQAASMEAAIDTARKAYGASAVQLASAINEPRYKKVRRAYSAANGWAWG